MPATPNPPDAPGTETPEAPPTPPKTSRYAMSAKDMSIRNIVWALGLTMAVVVVVGVLFFGVGGQDEREVPDNSRLDIHESAERAQQAASFPVAVPDLDEGWTVRSARYDGSGDPSWEVRYSTPSGSLVTMVASAELSPAMISSAVPGATQQGTLGIGGVECEELTSTTEEASRALTCVQDDWGVLVHGSAGTEELEELAGAALADIADGQDGAG